MKYFFLKFNLQEYWAGSAFFFAPGGLYQFGMFYAKDIQLDQKQQSMQLAGS